MKVIDLSADHRFDDPEFYATIYARHQHPESLGHTVYGLPELHREKLSAPNSSAVRAVIRQASFLLPTQLRCQGLLSSNEVIADCKSGVSGAGEARLPVRISRDR